MSLDAWSLLPVAVSAVGEKKAADILVLDIGSVSVICDYFVLASGYSTTQAKAIADHVEEKMKEAGAAVLRREGYREGRWILLDYGAIVVHVFLESEREFYNLERLWQDAAVVAL